MCTFATIPHSMSSNAVTTTCTTSVSINRRLALYSNRNALFFLRRGEVMVPIPRAQLGISALFKTSRIKFLATSFIGHQHLMLSSSYSSVAVSSEEEQRKGGKISAASSSSESSSSPSSFSSFSQSLRGLVADMGHQSSKLGVNFAWHQRDGVNSSSHSPLSSSSVKKPSSEQEQQRSKFLTLPTILTLARVASVPIFVATFYVNSWWGTAATTTLFIAAAITDWLDGYIARKMQLGTTFGAFLDPVADKLMVAATLVLLCSRPVEAPVFGDMPWLFSVPSITIIGREGFRKILTCMPDYITMSAVREWAAAQNSKLLAAVAVNSLGKWKTATQMTALTILLVSRDSSLAGSDMLAASGVVLLYISAGLAVWSLVVYMKKMGKVLLK